MECWKYQFKKQVNPMENEALLKSNEILKVFDLHVMYK